MVKLEKKREALLKKILAIKRLRRGTVSEQFFDYRDTEGNVRQQGPYFVHTSYRDGKRATKRICKGESAMWVADTKRFRVLKKLFNDFIDELEKATNQQDKGATNRNKTSCQK